MFLGDGRIEDKKERDERVWRKSSWETGSYQNFVCKSIYNPQKGRYMSRSGVWLHQYVVFPTQSGKSCPWYFISAHNPPHCSHLYLPSFLFSFTTLLLSQISKLSHPSLSLHVMIMSWHWVQVYTKYSIHPRLFVFPSFLWLRVDPWL